MRLSQSGGQFFSHRRGLRIIRQVLPFGRVNLMVIQLYADDRAAFVPPFGVTPALGAYGSARSLTALNLCVGGLFPGAPRRIEQRDEAAALEMRGRGQAAQLHERWIDVQELDQARAALASGFRTRCSDDQRRAGRQFKQGVLVPPAALAQVIAVIAEEDDDRRVGQLKAVERVEHFAHLRVGERDAGVVSAHELATLLIGEAREGFPECAARQRLWQLRRAVRRVLGELELFEWVEVEVLLRRVERIVRFVETEREEEWFIAPLFHQLDGFTRDLSVGLVFVLALGGQPATPFQAPARQIATFALVAARGRLKVARHVP